MSKINMSYCAEVGGMEHSQNVISQSACRYFHKCEKSRFSAHSVKLMSAKNSTSEMTSTKPHFRLLTRMCRCKFYADLTNLKSACAPRCSSIGDIIERYCKEEIIEGYTLMKPVVRVSRQFHFPYFLEQIPGNF